VAFAVGLALLLVQNYSYNDPRWEDKSTDNNDARRAAVSAMETVTDPENCLGAHCRKSSKKCAPPQ